MCFSTCHTFFSSPPHLFTNNIRNNFLPPPRCLLLLLLRGRHRPRFPACRHHHRNNIAPPAASAASAGAFLKCALDDSLPAVQPPRGASLSLLQTHTRRRRRRRRRRPVCFLLFDICVRLCCVFVLQACPSLLYIIHICSLLKYCLVSFQQHTTPYTHGEIKSINISHHTRTLETHTHTPFYTPIHGRRITKIGILSTTTTTTTSTNITSKDITMCPRETKTKVLN